MTAGPCVPVDDKPPGQGAGGQGGEQALDLRDGQRDHAGFRRWRLAGPDRGRCLGIGSVFHQRGGDGADRQRGHDQQGVADDRGVEPGLALVEPEAVLAELESSSTGHLSRRRGSAGPWSGPSRTEVSQLCGCCVPCCQDGFGLLWCGVCGGTLGNACGDQDAAELGEHVLEGGFGLGGVPGLGVAAGGDAGRAVAVPGIPHDDQGVNEQGERDGALDGAAGAVAGLPGAQDVAGVGEGLLDGLITNDKFCCVRRVQLSLTRWRRPLDLRDLLFIPMLTW